MSAVIEPEIVSSPSFLAPIGSNLTTKQNLFVQYYLQTRNGTQAARLAGYEGSYDVLSAQASENLRKPYIREAIESYYKSRLLSKDGVLAELSDIAGAPWRESVEVKMLDGTIIGAQLKLSDKIKAAELVGKFHGMFSERSESVNVNIELNGDDLAGLLAGALSDAGLTTDGSQD